MPQVSPGGLRRLADRRLGEARSIANDADRLRSEAAGLPGLLEPLLAVSNAVWAGPAADEFETNVGHHGRNLAEQSALVLRFAAELDDRAARLRSDAANLRDQAAAAEIAEMSLITPVPDGFSW